MTPGLPHPFFERARRPGGLDRPLVLGHRGVKAHITENSVESFAAARDAGADGVELDVHLCASGEVVVFHDATLSRMAGRGELVSQLSWDELSTMVIGRDSRIPTLEGFFRAFDDPDFLVNIEIKSMRLGRAAALVDAVLECVARERPNAAESVLISSFDPFVIGRVRQRAPTLCTGYLFHGDEPRVLRRAWRAPPFRPHALHPDHRLIHADRMSAWRAAGLAVVAWTVDGEHEIRRATSLGVDMLISDDPAHTLDVLADASTSAGDLASSVAIPSCGA